MRTNTLVGLLLVATFTVMIGACKKDDDSANLDGGVDDMTITNDGPDIDMSTIVSNFGAPPIVTDWIVTFGEGNVEPSGYGFAVIDVDMMSDGTVYMLVQLASAIDCDPSDGTDVVTPEFPGQSAVTKINPDGSYAWTRLTPAEFTDTSTFSTNFRIAVASDGSYYLACTTRIAKYSPSGEQQWIWADNAGGIINVIDIDVDAADNALFSAVWRGTGSMAGYRGAVSPDNHTQWSAFTQYYETPTGLGGTRLNFEEPGRLIAAPGGGALALTFFGGDYDLDPSGGFNIRSSTCASGCMVSGCAAQPAIDRYAPNGAYVSSWAYDRIQSVWPKQIMFDDTGAMLMFGSYSAAGLEDVDFDWSEGQDVHTPSAHICTGDIFVSRIEADGTYGGTTLWSVNVGQLIEGAGPYFTLTDLKASAWSAPHHTGYVVGYAYGSISTPTEVTELNDSAVNNFIMAVDDHGRAIWGTDITAMNVIQRRGPQSIFPFVGAASDGSVRILVSFSGERDLDIGPGVDLRATTSSAFALIKFHPSPCTEGTMECRCTTGAAFQSTRHCISADSPGLCDCEPTEVPDGGVSCLTTCEGRGLECGDLDDNCGGTVFCGTCAGGLACGDDNLCHSQPAVVVADGLNHPTSVVADATHVYWIERGTLTHMTLREDTMRVMRAPIDGSGEPELLDDTTYPNLGLRMTDELVLWADNMRGVIRGYDKSTHEISTYLENLIMLSGFASDDGYIYYYAHQNLGGGSTRAAFFVRAPEGTTRTIYVAPSLPSQLRFGTDGWVYFNFEGSWWYIDHAFSIAASTTTAEEIAPYLRALPTTYNGTTYTVTVGAYWAHAWDGSVDQTTSEGDSGPLIEGLNHPESVYVVGDSLYVAEEGDFSADTDNGRILKVDLTP